MATRTPLAELANGHKVTDEELNSLPRGEFGYATITADQGSITSEADVTSLTLTVTLSADRRYRWTLKGELVHATADGVALVKLTDGSNNGLERGVIAGTTTQSQPVFVTYEENGSGASVTRKARASKVSGTGAVTFGANSAYPARLTVEDIGPAFS